MLFYLLSCLFLNHISRAQVAQPPLQLFLQKVQSHYTPHPTHKNLRNHYYSLNAEKPKAIVFLPGMGESSIKYYNLFDHLELTDFTFYIWDHIGQGFSSHMLSENIEKVHIDSFETHIVALKNFLQILHTKHREIIVIGHSMGGHLALRLASENSALIDQLVLSSPLIDFNHSWIPVSFLSWIFSLFPESSYPPFYFLFTNRSEDKSFVTHSIERQKEYQKTLELFPHIKRQGATIGWIKAAQESIHKMSITDFHQLSTSVYILQAESDLLVDNEKQNHICKRIPHCRIDKFQNSKHEILFEVDEVRGSALKKIRQFITDIKNR